MAEAVAKKTFNQQVPTTSLFYQALLKTVVRFVVKTRADIPLAAEMRSVFHQTAPGFALEQLSGPTELDEGSRLLANEQASKRLPPRASEVSI